MTSAIQIEWRKSPKTFYYPLELPPSNIYVSVLDINLCKHDLYTWCFIRSEEQIVRTGGNKITEIRSNQIFHWSLPESNIGLQSMYQSIVQTEIPKL